MQEEKSGSVVNVDAVELKEDGSAVVIIDQTLLPNRVEYIELTTPKQMYDAIFQLKVRGAPAIGVCAGYCYYVLARGIALEAADWQTFKTMLHIQKEYQIGRAHV